jgi:hypothetical protein
LTAACSGVMVIGEARVEKVVEKLDAIHKTLIGG